MNIKRRLKIYIAVFLFLSLVIFIDQRVSFARGIFDDRDFGPASGPTLLSPATKDINLKSQPSLEFRWERTDMATTDYYEFRLYKGYQTVEDTLIMKKRIPTDEYPFKLDAETFEVGQVYTWSLMQVFDGGVKSDKSFASFKIIQK